MWRSLDLAQLLSYLWDDKHDDVAGEKGLDADLFERSGQMSGESGTD